MEPLCGDTSKPGCDKTAQHLLFPAVSTECLQSRQVKEEAGVGGDPQLSITVALYKVNPVSVN